MSRDMYIACLNCRESLWIGQTNIIYTGSAETMGDLNVFLVKHRTYLPREYSEPKSEYHELLYMPEPYNGSFESIDWEYMGEGREDTT